CSQSGSAYLAAPLIVMERNTIPNSRLLVSKSQYHKELITSKDLTHKVGEDNNG
ncbi:hypothetical protein Tco_1324131, partial [Tanacetum coccineum]